MSEHKRRPSVELSNAMTRLIIYVFAIAAIVTGAVWMANEPGTVQIVWRGWRVDTSVGILIAVTIASVLFILFVLRLVSILSGTVRAFAAAQKERRMQRGITALGDGFAAVQSGQGAVAQRLAKEAGKLLDNNPAVLVLRKEAADLGGDSREMQAAAMALLNRPQTELTALRSLANKALNDGDVVGALRHAQKALARKDAPPWALSMVLDVQISMGRWADALSVLETKLGKTVFEPQVYQRLKSKLLVQEAHSALKNGEAAGAATAAKKAMDTSNLSTEAVTTYAKAMASQGKGRKAAGAVEKAWQLNPHAELLAAYKMLVPGESALDWAKRVENLAKVIPDHPETRLAVAAASLNAELWGQARNRLSPLTNDDMTPDIRARAAQLMAELEKCEREDAEAAEEWLKLALSMQQSAAPSLHQPKSTQDLLAQA